LHGSLVGLFVVLISLDTASACRLLRNRCCCCCICPAAPSCSAPVAPPSEKQAAAETSAEPQAVLPSVAEAKPDIAEANPPIEPMPDTLVPASTPSETPVATETPLVIEIPTKPESAASSNTEAAPAKPIETPTVEVPTIVEQKTAPVPPAPPIATQPTPAVIDPPVSPAPEPAPAPVLPAPSAAALPPAAEPAAPVAEPTPLDDPFAPVTPAAPAKAVETPIDNTPVAAAETPLPSPLPTQTLPPDADDPFAPVKPMPKTTEKAKTPVRPMAAPIAPELDPLNIATDGKLPAREWIDDSGAFKINARLVLILDGKVRLLKDTGRTTTVELARLSTADREYVASVIARYGKDLNQLDQVAAR
jgi:hypothetical protein